MLFGQFRFEAFRELFKFLMCIVVFEAFGERRELSRARERLVPHNGQVAADRAAGAPSQQVFARGEVNVKFILGPEALRATPGRAYLMGGLARAHVLVLLRIRYHFAGEGTFEFHRVQLGFLVACEARECPGVVTALWAHSILFPLGVRTTPAEGVFAVLALGWLLYDFEADATGEVLVNRGLDKILLANELLYGQLRGLVPFELF